jgi:subtilisin family serine protease
VAGIIGALDNGFGVVGVAPGARLWSVKVLDAVGSGTLSSVLRGLDWVRTQSATIDVVNMSFTLPGYSQALHDAVQSLVDVGVAVAVAAGNGHVDAAGYSPAAFDNVVTVSAMADFDGKPGGVGAPTCAFDQDDTAADFSNLGTVVDMTAPGACIESTLPTSRGSYGTMSGTSMASPHVAGALALLARASRPTTAAQVQAMVARLLAAGSNEWTDDSGDGAQEPLLDVGTPSLFAAGPAVCAPVSTLGLIGSWRGSDTLAADAGPSLSGSVAYTPAVTAHGMLFDETSIATTPSLPAVGTAVSVEMWVEPARVPPIGRIEVLASRWAPGPDDSTRSFALMFDPRGRLLWTVDDTSTRRPDELEVEAPTLSDGAFHHVAATWDGSLMTVYVDGVLAGTAKGRGGRLNATVGIAFRVGGKQGGGAAPFAGIIDDPSAWARALTGGEIASIAAAGAGGRCP